VYTTRNWSQAALHSFSVSVLLRLGEKLSVGVFDIVLLRDMVYEAVSSGWRRSWKSIYLCVQILFLILMGTVAPAGMPAENIAVRV